MRTRSRHWILSASLIVQTRNRYPAGASNQAPSCQQMSVAAFHLGGRLSPWRPQPGTGTVNTPPCLNVWLCGLCVCVCVYSSAWFCVRQHVVRVYVAGAGRHGNTPDKVAKQAGPNLPRCSGSSKKRTRRSPEGRMEKEGKGQQEQERSREGGHAICVPGRIPERS